MKLWEPIEDLEIKAIDRNNELCEKDDPNYSSHIIGMCLSDGEAGYSLAEIITGRGYDEDRELAKLILKGIKGADILPKIVKIISFPTHDVEPPYRHIGDNATLQKIKDLIETY